MRRVRRAPSVPITVAMYTPGATPSSDSETLPLPEAVPARRAVSLRLEFDVQHVAVSDVAPVGGICIG